MKAPVVARKSHKWLTLIIGTQALLWMVSGAYMTVVDIDFIHGDSLVRNTDESLPAGIGDLYPVADILDRFSVANTVDLVARQGSPYYVVRSAQETVLLNAKTGATVSPIAREQAESLARHYYAADGDLIETSLLTNVNTRPSEIQTRPLPLWQAVFDDNISTTFYISPSTGELITRRHAFWRVYDFLWMFHIMDYENRSDINNNLLRVAAAFGLVTALSGMWLLVHSLRGSMRRSRRSKSTEIVEGSRSDSVPKTA